jgi:hypothetical protein
MTDSDVARIEPYWFGRPEAEIRAAAEARDEAWAAVPGYSRYEWCDKSIEVTRAGDTFTSQIRRVGEGFMVLKMNKLSSAGYRQVNVTDDTGRRVTVDVAPMVLLAHHPAFRGLDRFPDGLETRHNPSIGDKTFNAYPEGIWPGTKAENHADKPAPGGRPTFACRNAQDGCPNRVINEGRRCMDCVDAVRRDAAAQLEAGVPLDEIAAGFGNSPSWIYRLAVEGGYGGSIGQARGGRPLCERCTCPACERRRGSWRRRLAVTLRGHSKASDGQ